MTRTPGTRRGFRTARTSKHNSEFVEGALRQYLGFDLLERIWARNDMPEDEAMALALEAQENK